ncbi:2TM domain-containing protein [Aquimarina brevivitae]|uniref:2TM domain-containing protein n=1 Tax=Aquimarina brevivitae TaxID=323412 RepID=A0A4Q7P0L8_9FLAO|nr:2TM domain-containing protein [Aquimarina brevivitae]RZS93343.1 2TM domain-containing protein [Aquimarina brevivitae]
MSSDNLYENYKRAKQRVKKEREFYGHLVAYLIMNVVILVFKSKLLQLIMHGETDPNFELWWDYNLIFTPLFWGIGLLFHGLWAFEKTILFNKKWEKKKIEHYVNETKDKRYE